MKRETHGQSKFGELYSPRHDDFFRWTGCICNRKDYSAYVRGRTLATTRVDFVETDFALGAALDVESLFRQRCFLAVLPGLNRA